MPSDRLPGAAVAFVYWFVPETKGRSVEDIIELFEGQATSDAEAGAGADTAR